MKKSIKTFLVAVLLLANCGLLFSQQTWLELGDKYFDQFAYKKAIKLYEGAKDRDPNNWDIYAKLGDCYFYISMPEKAKDYYKIAIDNTKNIKESYLLKYALCLQSIEPSQKPVITAFQDYYKKIGKTEDISSRDSTYSSTALAENLSINSEFSDFGTFIINDKLYFASSRQNPNKKRSANKRLYKWNGQPFLDIYEAVIDRHTDSLRLVLPDSSNVDKHINTNAHQASVAITNDGKTMYFSGGNVKHNNTLEYDKSGTSKLRLQRATLINNNWVVTDADKKAMEYFDFENFSIGNPALSPDNKRLFFVTCAPFEDANGHTDIYYVDINDDKTYGKVKIVPGINTGGRESFPFIASDGTFYFSSDGIFNNTLGLGLFDIYKVNNIDQVIQTGKANIIHLDSPFNSDKDDFAYFEEPEQGDTCEVYAYFSSNREGSNAKGDDDIYRVKVKKNKTVQGLITDSSNKNPLPKANVDLIDASGMVLKTVQADSTGAFSFNVECNQLYRLRGSMARYDDDLKEYIAAEAKSSINLELKPFPCEISINQIEFALDSADIRADAKNALSKLKDILFSNPDIKIRIESYTDSRGPAQYNLDLSEKRAQNTKLYLIGEGVKDSQIISATGFGEKCLIISDEDIKKLPTEKERNEAHQKNRRSRFILDCEDGFEGCHEANRDD
ncbi:OmpA family protein [Flavobacteriaceae bacterium LMO-SS05]